MLRRSLQVFFGTALLGLLLTVGYALLHLRGPEEMLAEAEEHFRQRQWARVVNVLRHGERSASLQESPELRSRFLQLRWRAFSQLDQPAAALPDLEALLEELAEPPIELRLEHVRVLARLDRGAEALRKAQEVLAAHPEHGRALELAGEACRTLYDDELRELLASMDVDAGAIASRAAKSSALGFLFRPEGDPGVAAEWDRLETHWRSQPRLRQNWPDLSRSLRELRSRVQESLGYFAKSLEASGTPVAAFDGMALALEQAGRLDDLTALCEIHLRRFDHVYAADAAGVLAWAHVRSGLLAAAVDLGDRWLPPGAWRQKLQRGQLAANVEDLLLAKATALFRLGARDAASIHAGEAGAMLAELPIPVAGHVSTAFARILQGDTKDAELHCEISTRLLFPRAEPVHTVDLLAELVPQYLDLMRARGAAPQELLDVLTKWAAARPAATAPLVARARTQIAAGEGAAAFATATSALARRPHDEELLRVLAEAADAAFRGANGDGPALLRQCLARGAVLPDVRHPVSDLTCGEQALAEKHFAIALHCGRRAADSFPWATWPRLLEARAATALGDHALAASVLEKLLAVSPGNEDALAAWFHARRRAGLPATAHLADVLRTAPASVELAAALLRSALDADPVSALPLAERAEVLSGATPELLALAARAFAAAGQAARARETLLRAGPGDGGEALAVDMAEAAAAVLAAGGAGDALEARQLVAAHRWMSGPANAALLRAARALAAAGRDAEARACVETAIASADVEHRSGDACALAGDVAARLGDLRAAESHWTAAVSFADGAKSAEDLARLLLLGNRPERAAQAYELAGDPRDPALALACGAVENVAGLARTRLAADSGDLCATIAEALVPQSTVENGAGTEPHGDGAQRVLTAGLQDLPAELRRAIAAIAAIAAHDALAAASVDLTAKLHATLPRSPAVTLLHARALRCAGRTAEARELHVRLHDDGCRDPVLFREVALAARAGGDPLPSGLSDAMHAAAAGLASGSPPVVVFAAHDAASRARAAGDANLAASLLAELWLSHPEASGVRTADAIALAETGRLRTAVELLARSWRSQRGAERRAAIDALFTYVDELLRSDPTLAPMARGIAAAVLAEDGPRGAALHFLLGTAALPDEPQIPPQRVRSWLVDHLELVATGADCWPMGLRSIAELERRFGAEEALAEVEVLLARRPAVLPAWRERARLLAVLQRGAEGVAALRRLVPYAADDELALACVTQAAEQRALAPGDERMLAELPEALRESGHGCYARGLAALRGGRAGEALPLLERAAPRADGAHLYHLAIAALSSTRADGGELAAGLFRRLGADYPSSTLARYAGSFERQLAPR